MSWKDFSIIFAGHFIDRIKYIQNQFAKGAKNYEQTIASLNSYEPVLDRYIVLVKAFYEQKYGKKFKYFVKNKK